VIEKKEHIPAGQLQRNATLPSNAIPASTWGFTLQEQENNNPYFQADAFIKVITNICSRFII